MMRIAELRRRVFARHSHPVSAWSRFWTTPLLLAPLWTKRLSVGAGVGAWFAINPVMTPVPTDRRAFATRAMLGEEIWSADPGQDRMLIGLNAAGTVVLAGALVAAWQRRAIPATLATVSSMAMTMLCWQRYAARYDAAQDRGAAE